MLVEMGIIYKTIQNNKINNQSGISKDYASKLLEMLGIYKQFTFIDWFCLVPSNSLPFYIQ